MKGTNAQNKASLMRWREKISLISPNLLGNMLRQLIKKLATIRLSGW